MISNASTASFQGLTPTTPAQGYNQATSHLAGSKHIEYFTNQQIKDGTAKNKGFIDVSANSGREILKYGFNVADQVGGFMITNESGVTYHYALPVYAYYQVNKTFETGKEASVYQKSSENHPYAYTWYLTAVTGSDYVNRNSANDGTISNLDWGYWVKFTYQLQTNSFIWRNPTVGTHKDLDHKIESYSYGQKELFYLDKIQTQSHIAVFEKSERVDGRGVNNGITGSFNQSSVTNCYTDPNCNPADCTDPDPRTCDGYCQICETTPVLAAKTLKLDKIYLLTMADYLQAGTLLSKALRVISLNTDYSLALGTLNSFSDSNVVNKLGKLTLNSVTFLGKAGAALTPPISFAYGKNPAYNKDAFDMWGMYKSDYSNSNNDNLDRLVTSTSYLDLDAWSLSSITTSLGAKISVDYEGDTYGKPALYFSNVLNVKSVTPNSNYGSVRIEFHNTVDLSSMINVNSSVAIMGLISYPFYRGALPGHSCDGQLIGQYGENYKSVKFDFDQNQIEHIANTYVDVVNEQLFKDVTMVLGQYPLPATLPYPKNDINVPCYNNLGQQVVINVTYSLSPRWMSGNMAFKREFPEFLGGGIRVNKISINENENLRTTIYSYLQGMTSYEPMGLDNYILQNMENITNLSGNPWNAIIDKRQKTIDSFLSNLYDQFSDLLTISRELPAPGVIYEKVTITEEIKKAGETSTIQIQGSKDYEFQVFDENIVERLGITKTSNPYAVICKDAQGEPVPCNGTGEFQPVTCMDQYNQPIACGTQPSGTENPLTLKDFSSWVGNLKSFTTYGPNNEILEKTTNQYLHDGKTNDQFIQDLKLKFNSQGIITQTFNENRMPVGYVFSRRDEFPLVAIGQTTTNYKTGITTSSQNLAFDFYTGDPLKVLHTDGYGNKYVSESMPAYSLDSYSGMTSTQVLNGFIGMGLKVNNPKNKHMLTQVVKTSTFKVNDNFATSQLNSDKLALVSASAQTWNDQVPVLGIGTSGTNAPQTGVWRQRASYNFIGDETVALRTDGLYPYANFNEFTDWTGNTGTANWQKLSEIKLFDTYSHALEAADLNGNFAATKMSLDQTRVFATASNAQYSEFAFSGLEETVGQNGALGGGVKLNGTVASGNAHTGNFSASATLNTKGFSYTFTNTGAKKYHVAVWANRSDAVLKLNTGIIPTTFTQAGSWYLIEGDVDIAVGSNIEISCEARNATTLFDDFRVHPLKAAMVSYVYSPWGELKYILDNNNLFTEYEYDGMGRLTKVYKETFLHGRTQTSQTVYHYANH